MLKKKLIEFFGLDKFNYEKIVIDKNVLLDIVDFARENHPREFIMFLEGEIKNKKLQVFGLNYQEYVANEKMTLSRVDFPLGSKIVGSIHSHPGPNNEPSRADLRFFAKQGLLHLIIKQPYRIQDIQGYDLKGRKIAFEIKEN